MAQDKENRSKLRAKEVREVNQYGHASVPSNPSQGENAETPIANKKDTSGSGNDNLVSPGFSRQRDAVTAQQSQYLVSPVARFSNVSHPSPVNNLNTGTQHPFNLPHENQSPSLNPLGDHNVHSHIAEAPHRDHYEEQNQHPIANHLDGDAFHPSVAGDSHHRDHNQVSLPNGYGSDC